MRGALLFAPCGSGKSYFVERASKELRVEDGDTILAEANVKNRNYFWYEGRTSEQMKIRDCINRKLDEGINVLYSGNPLIWSPDVIYLPPELLRWDRISRREGFHPTREQFEREQHAYEEASEKIDTFRSIEELVRYIKYCSVS